ncbi:hypothetical protein VNO78_03000 [Psophocarpus tetragonolobus]|uniref:Uncharacterized protein n=1 Tax=Psophocarpus tetragonolobus TaxID=3891 RepID=A0AAN9T1A1_PSOTE
MWQLEMKGWDYVALDRMDVVRQNTNIVMETEAAKETEKANEVTLGIGSEVRYRVTDKFVRDVYGGMVVVGKGKMSYEVSGGDGGGKDSLWNTSKQRGGGIGYKRWFGKGPYGKNPCLSTIVAAFLLDWPTRFEA